MNAEPERQFVDTDILVYAHDRSAGEKYARAQAVLRDLWQTGAGCLSVQVLQDLFVTLTLKVPQPLSVENVRRLVADLATWQVHAPQAEDVLMAIDLQGRYQTSFWGAMILQSAGQLGAKMVLSEDLNPDQDYAGLQVANPLVVS
jgi:predicted nucleic acid-binding protein